VTNGVLIHVEDPGAANYIAPLPKALSSLGLRSVLIAEATGAALLEQRGIVSIPRAARSASTLLDEYAPSIVLVGTSENVDTESHAIVLEARKRGIPSAGVVDAYANAAHRFRGRTDAPLSFVPDVLFVPDDWTARAYHELGLDPSRVHVCGHPQYDFVLEERARLSALERASLRRTVLPSIREEDPLVLFVSEVSTGLLPTQYRRSEAYTLQGRGSSDERTPIVLEEIIDGLSMCWPQAKLVVRLHPKNTREEFGTLLDEVAGVSVGGSSLEAVWSADLVIGMSSMLLFEAALLKRPTLSVLPRDIEREWLSSTRIGATPCVTTREALRDHLRTFAGASDRKATTIEVKTGSTTILAHHLIALWKDARP
jgi:hypothetical protein